MYTPLDPTRREIRLLEIVKGTNSGPIECVFHIVSLEDDIEFAALSYVWGSSDITKEILLNGQRRDVTKNLESALRHFWSNFATNGINVIRRFNLLEDFIENDRDISSLEIVHDSGANEDQYDKEDDDGGYGDDEDTGSRTDTSTDDNAGENEEDDGCSGGSEGEADSNAYTQSIIERIICAYEHAKVGGGGLLIWIDALCINQDDLSEKSHQIQLMRDIYKKAHRVFSWLGSPDDRKIDFALKTIRRITPCLRPGRESERNLIRRHPELFNWRVAGSITSNQYWNAISNFAKSENFKRLWIFQELLAARDPTFICGEEYLPMSCLRRYMRWGASIPQFPQRTTPSSADDDGVWDILRLKLPRFGVLFDILLAEQPWEELVDKTYLFIEIVRGWHCQDPRDKVFALLGVFPMTTLPDYNKSVIDVYADWATDPLWDVPPEFLLSHSGIGLYPRGLADGNFPSWMPQLDMIGKQIQPWDIIWKKPSASPKAPEYFRPTVSRATGITCYGVQVTEVSEVLTRPSKTASSYNFPEGQRVPHKESGESSAMENGHGILAPILAYLQANRQQLWNEPYPTGGSRLQAFIQTVIDCVIDGSTPEIVPNLSFRDLIRAIKNHTPKKLGTIHDISQQELKLLGFTSEKEDCEFVSNASTDDDSNDPNTGRMSEPAHRTAANEVALRLFFIAMEKSIFHTRNGLLGLGPPGMKQGDLVYLIHGSSLPVLLRKTAEGTFNVGSCYVNGISGIGASSILNIRENDVRKVIII
ncbi:heterokaryon incompatibility protein-domain-containing protein [Nemania sp. FL0031]|nr:heterokaryon incompatibility protein-domain-containing protein [Nemania sp. FL0031]